MTQTTATETMTRFAVYVVDDNGWKDGCPNYELVFLGSHSGEFVGPWEGGHDVAGEVQFDSRDAAEAFLSEMDRTGDWVAPPEVNPECEESRPTYAVRQIA